MDSRELRYVLKVAEEKSFSKAAQKLYITQPSLSQYIMKLEEKLGVRLFDRNTVPLTLTPAGEHFAEKAQNILNLTSQLQHQMKDISKLQNERITLGITPYRGRWFLPKILPLFHTKYPNIEVNIIEDSSLKLEQLVLNGDIDFSLQILPLRNKGLDYHPIHTDELLIAISPKHPISLNLGMNCSNTTIHPKIHLSELKDEFFIILKTDFTGRKITNELFEIAGFSPKILFETNSLDSAHDMAASGIAITFVPETLALYYAPQFKATYFSIEEKQLFTVLTIAYKENSHLSKAAFIFLETVKQVFN